MNVLRLLTTVSELGLAVVLGGLIGFERQWHQKMAGLANQCAGRAGRERFRHPGIDDKVEAILRPLLPRW